MRLAPAHIRERREKLRVNPTRCESLLLDLIRLLNELYPDLRITFQQILRHSRNHVIVDFYSWSARISWELDGKHHRENKAQAARDRERDQLLKMDCGIEVIRIPNSEVLNDCIGVAHQMAALCLQKLGRESELLTLEQFELEVERDIYERLGLPTPS